MIVCACPYRNTVMVSTTVGTTVTNSTAVSFTSLLLSHINNSKKRYNEIAIGCDSRSWIGMNSTHDNQGDYLLCDSYTPSEVPPSTPVCQKDEFQCSNGRCISSVLRCNYFNDCEDYGSDEIHCSMKGALCCGILS